MAISYINKIVVSKDLLFLNAVEPLKLKVTARDIEKGTQKNSKACPFVIAACRISGVRRAYVLRTKAFLEYNHKMVRYNLDSLIQNVIKYYDKKGEMKSGVYELSSMPIVKTPAKQREYYKKVKKKRAAGKMAPTKKVGPWPSGIRTLQEPID